MESGAREQLKVEAEPTILAGVILPDFSGDPHDPFGELRALAHTAGAEVVYELMQKRQTPEPATYLGKGKVEELADLVREHGAKAVVFENDLTPRQIANVEERIECKVLDRSELILDIFAGRAQTHEAKLQVELAQLEYTYPRLRAMWSHLERIAGGSPTGMGTRGPGEQQLEIDRRIVQRKKSQLKREITQLQGRRSREVEARNKEHYTVGLVGYTNAGKSTLFNTATDAHAYADDKLFATLSTRTKAWHLGGGDRVLLSDTVGFVRDLPHHLVASFKATLEEAIHSDLLLVVIDISHPRAEQQMHTVMQVLDEIGATAGDDHPGPVRQLVLNKVDRLQHNANLLVFERMYPDAVCLSARTGQGLDDLVERVRRHSRGGDHRLTLTLPITQGRAIQFLENRAQVHDRGYDGDAVVYDVTIGARQVDQLKAMGAEMTIAGPDAAHHAELSTGGWGR